MLKTASGNIISLGKTRAEGGERFLRLGEVVHITGLSRATIYALAAACQFPKQIKISARTSGWLLSEVEAFMATRIAESRPQ